MNERFTIGKVDTTSLYKDYNYSYPEDLDLRPTSTLHNELVNRVLERAWEAYAAISPKYDAWNKIDHHLTGYVPKNEDELLLKAKDSRTPVSVVVPLSYAVRETLLTYMVQTFLTPNYFPMQGVEPGDYVGAVLLEHHLQQQAMHAAMELDLHTLWGSAYSYGLGVAHVVWDRESSMVETSKPRGLSGPGGEFIQVGEDRDLERRVTWEGNRLVPIDVYKYLPDPNFPAHKVQDFEYVGWWTTTNRMNLLEKEKSSPEETFNCRYLPCFDSHSKIFMEESGREDSLNDSRIYNSSQTSSPVDIITLYITLIPAEWGLGSEEYPEKWVFTVANGSLLIQASKLNLRHNRYPVVVCCPDFDGFSLAPFGRMETIYGLQEVADWLFSSHITNIRKAINNSFIVDPQKINMADLLNPSANKIIRTRRAMWGQGVQDAIQQLPVNDVTRNHINDVGFISEIIQRVSGATDALQGLMTSSRERLTATEYSGSKGSALSRLEKGARVISAMTMRPLAFLLASHTIQLTTKETYIRLNGEWPMLLMQELGPRLASNNSVLVAPSELDINFDIIPKDQVAKGSDDLNNWVSLFQMINGNPELLQRLDVTRIFLSIARRMGETNAADFIRQIQPTVLPDQQVANMAADGELEQV